MPKELYRPPGYDSIHDRYPEKRPLRLMCRACGVTLRDPGGLFVPAPKHDPMEIGTIGEEKVTHIHLCADCANRVLSFIDTMHDAPDLDRDR
jgi:hypothetical protein